MLLAWIPACGAVAGQPALALRVEGNHLVDSRGAVLQLRGASISGLEGGMIFGGRVPWSSAGFGGRRPRFAPLAAWKLNVVRLPLNEDAWLGKRVKKTGGRSLRLDGRAYRNEVVASVADANAAGLYVIVDLHWSAPDDFSADAQNPMADQDNSLRFWQSVAETFKSNPAVLFELFNEPYVAPASEANGAFEPSELAARDANTIIRDGGSASSYFAHQDGRFDTPIRKQAYAWRITGYQALIDTIRAAGATNVLLAGGNHYSNDLTWWSQQPPSDPERQLAASLHAYAGGYPYSLKNDVDGVDAMLAPIATRYPVVITELGDEVGSDPASFAASVLSWADRHGYSVLAWCWNPWDGANTLIRDAHGNAPTAGFGRTFHDWAAMHQS